MYFVLYEFDGGTVKVSCDSLRQAELVADEIAAEGYGAEISQVLRIVPAVIVDLRPEWKVA
jgi:hypothetical protein